MKTLTPKDPSLAGTLTEVRAGRFTDQRRCEALRDDLAAQQPAFKRGLDVIQDLQELLSREAASQAPPPAAAPVVTAPAPAAPRTASPQEALVAEYRAAESDPKKLSALFADKEKGPRLRNLVMNGQAPEGLVEARPTDPVNERQPVTADLMQLASKPVAITELASVYERVKNSPAALSRFLSVNQDAVRDLVGLVEA